MILHKEIVVISGELKVEAVGWSGTGGVELGGRETLSFFICPELFIKKKKNYSSILLCNLSKKF